MNEKVNIDRIECVWESVTIWDGRVLLFVPFFLKRRRTHLQLIPFVSMWWLRFVHIASTSPKAAKLWSRRGSCVRSRTGPMKIKSCWMRTSRPKAEHYRWHVYISLRIENTQGACVSNVLRLNNSSCSIYSIRLDATEFLKPRPNDSAPPQILFVGNLLIEDLAWLSPQGLEYLEIDLRSRAPANDQTWTLREIYRMKRKITLKVSCEKVLPASHLLSEYTFLFEKRK